MKLCKYIALILTILICCQKKENAKEQFFKLVNNELSKNAKRCSCGKYNYELYDISVNDISEKSKLIQKLGKPDTAFADTVMVACTSFVYNCESEFVSFHFNKVNKYIGQSFGQIDNGKYIISGSNIILGEDTK